MLKNANWYCYHLSQILINFAHPLPPGYGINFSKNLLSDKHSKNFHIVEVTLYGDVKSCSR